MSAYLEKQMYAMFPDGHHRLDDLVDAALERIGKCFASIALPGYERFDHLHGDQYATFLYFASNEAWKAGHLTAAKKLFLLNKALNGIVVMYDTILPEVFVLLHTVGTVLGKATYGNYFVAAQNVTVGMHRGATPHLGERTVLYGGSSVLGDSLLGGRVTVASNTTLIDYHVLPGRIAAGVSPNIIVKRATRDVSELYFK